MAQPSATAHQLSILAKFQESGCLNESNSRYTLYIEWWHPLYVPSTGLKKKTFSVNIFHEFGALLLPQLAHSAIPRQLLRGILAFSSNDALVHYPFPWSNFLVPAWEGQSRISDLRIKRKSWKGTLFFRATDICLMSIQNEPCRLGSTNPQPRRAISPSSWVAFHDAYHQKTLTG